MNNKWSRLPGHIAYLCPLVLIGFNPGYTFPLHDELLLDISHYITHGVQQKRQSGYVFNLVINSWLSVPFLPKPSNTPRVVS